MNSKAKKGKKINTTCLNGESKGHNIWKTNFTKNLAKTLIRYDKKADFFIQLFDHIEFWIILYNIFSP